MSASMILDCSLALMVVLVTWIGIKLLDHTE